MIQINKQPVPKKEGLYIIVKQIETGLLVASTNPHQHFTLAEATAEAERLAMEVPKASFIVMQAVSLSKTTEVKTTKFKV